MMSLSEIIRLNEEASRRINENTDPYSFPDKESIKSCPPFPFPYVGNKALKGWELLDNPPPFFVDSSGFGSEREPALTGESFKLRLLDLFEEHPEYGYAVIETGEFQVHVGIFQRTQGKSHTSGKA